VILTLTSLTWLNYRYSSLFFVGDEFLPRWLGTRLFLMQGQSPYDEQTSLAIQEMSWERYGPSDEVNSLYLYPFYSILVFFPFALVSDFDAALAIWLTLLEICIIVITFLSLSLTQWKLRVFGVVLLLFFSILWYHDIRALISGNSILLVSLFISVALLAIRSNHDGLAGFFLAMALIQPHVVWLIVLYIMVWSIASKRWVVFWSFFGSLVLLVVSFSLIIPDWTWQYFLQIFFSFNRVLSLTPGNILQSLVPGIGKQLGWLLTILLVASLIWEWRQSIHKEYRWFLWTCLLTLTITTLIGLPSIVENYVILFPSMILVMATWYQRWGRLGRVLAFLGAFVMLFGLWGFAIHAVRGKSDLDYYPFIFFFVPGLVLVGLYWVRWWAIDPPQLFLRNLPE